MCLSLGTFSLGCATDIEQDEASDERIGETSSSLVSGVQQPCASAPSTNPLGQPTDIAGAWNNGGQTTVVPYISTGSTFVQGGGFLTGGGWGDTVKWMAGDVTGDGIDDMLAIWPDGATARMAVRQSNLGGVFTWATGAWNPPGNPPFAAADSWMPGDVNGDGRVDVMRLYRASTTFRGDVWLSNGSSLSRASNFDFWFAPAGNVPTGRWVTGDFNGDGRADVGLVYQNGSLADVEVWISTGYALARQSWNLHQPNPAWSNDARYMTGDFDGDGLSDIFEVTKAQVGATAYTYAHVYRSIGSNFNRLTGIQLSVGWMSYANWLVGDFDGDGRSDLGTTWPSNGTTAVITVRKSSGTQFQNPQHWLLNAGGWAANSVYCAGLFSY